MFVLDELLELLLLLLLEVAADRAARALSLNSLMSGKELTEKNMLFFSILNFLTPLDQSHTLNPNPDPPGD